MRKEAIYHIPMTKKDSEAPLMMEYMLEVGEEVTINRSSSVFNVLPAIQKFKYTKNVSMILGTFGNKFVVTPQICLAINDIDYVLQFIDPFVRGNL